MTEIVSLTFDDPKFDYLNDLSKNVAVRAKRMLSQTYARAVAKGLQPWEGDGGKPLWYRPISEIPIRELNVDQLNDLFRYRVYQPRSSQLTEILAALDAENSKIRSDNSRKLLQKKRVRILIKEATIMNPDLPDASEIVPFEPPEQNFDFS